PEQTSYYQKPTWNICRISANKPEQVNRNNLHRYNPLQILKRYADTPLRCYFARWHINCITSYSKRSRTIHSTSAFPLSRTDTNALRRQDTDTQSH
ncbi:hypothetical protein M5D96_000149, partial [Drosophila gunungcola]